MHKKMRVRKEPDKKALILKYLDELKKIPEHSLFFPLVKNFFKEYFKVKSQVTFEELSILVPDKNLKENIQMDISELSLRLSELEFSRKKQLKLNKEIFKFKKILRSLLSKEQSRSESHVKIAINLLIFFKIIYLKLKSTLLMNHYALQFSRHKTKCISYIETKNLEMAHREYSKLVLIYQLLDASAKSNAHEFLTVIRINMLKLIKESRAPIVKKKKHGHPVDFLIKKIDINFKKKDVNAAKKNYLILYSEYNKLNEEEKEKYYNDIINLRSRLGG